MPDPSPPVTPIRNHQKVPPPHLSEFYSFVNGGTNNNHNHNHNHNNNNNNNNVFQSPVSTATTTAESVNTNSTDGRVLNPSFISTSSNLSNYANSEADDDEMGKIIVTLKDILKIIAQYKQVILKAEQYSAAVEQVSKASSEFGESIEGLIKLKGCDEVGEDFYKSSGLQYFNSNYELILSKMVKANFVEPLKLKLAQFQQYQLQRDANYQKQIKLKLKNLQLKEVELKKFNRVQKKNLNLSKYKINLVSLTNELDEIENFKRSNYQEILSNLTKFHKDVLLSLSMIIRSQLEINETIAKKSWSGGGLDELISKCPDPFNIDEVEDDYYRIDGTEDVTLNDIVDDDIGDGDVDIDQADEEDGITTAAAAATTTTNTTTDGLTRTVSDTDSMRENSFSLPIIPNGE